MDWIGRGEGERNASRINDKRREKKKERETREEREPPAGVVPALRLKSRLDAAGKVRRLTQRARRDKKKRQRHAFSCFFPLF